MYNETKVKLGAWVLVLVCLLGWPRGVAAEDKEIFTSVIPKLPKTANDPELSGGRVYPEWGPVCQRYTYSVVYRDKEGRKPEYIRIYFNGKMLDLKKADSGDSDYKRGVRYEYKFVPTKIDSNFYYFEASNGLGKTRDSIIDSPDNGPVLFASAFDKNEIVVVDATGEKKWSYPTGEEWVGGVALSADGKYLAALTSKHVYFFSTGSNKPLWGYEFNQGSPVGGGPRGNGIAISADGGRIAAAAGMEVALFGVVGNKPIWKYPAPALAVDISRDGKYVAAATVKDEKNMVLVWQAEKSQPVRQFGADSNFHDVSLSADGQYGAASTGCPDRRAYLFSRDSDKPLVVSERLTFDSPVSKARISADGSMAAFATEGGPDSSVAVLFSQGSARPVWKFDNQKKNSARAMSLTPDGKYVAVATMRGDVYLLDKGSNQPVKTWQTNSSVGALDVADDGSLVALGGSDSSLWILPKSGGEKKIPMGEFVQAVDVAANGKLIAAGTGGSVYFFESYLASDKNKTFQCQTIREPPPEGRGWERGEERRVGFWERLVRLVLGMMRPNTKAGCGDNYCDPGAGETRKTCLRDCAASF